jgi:hypothetical protein
MACLDRGLWLNDEVMNFYISLLLVGGAGAGAGEGRVGGCVQAQQQGWLVLGLRILLLNKHSHPVDIPKREWGQPGCCDACRDAA